MRATGRYDVPVVDSRSRKEVNGKMGLFQVCFRYFRSVFFYSTRHRLRCYRAREEIFIFKCARTVVLLLQSSRRS